MPMVNLQSPRDPNQELLAQGAAGLGAAIAQNIVRKRLNADRTAIEQRINEAGTFQDALSVIENAPFRVKDNFHDELLERARARFPEQELISVLTPDGGIRKITQEKGRPLSDDEIEARGFLPATQHVIVSTGPDGDIEIHDVALGMGAAGEDMQRLQEMFPGRTFQIAQGPETETFFKIKDQQLRSREIESRDRETRTKLTPADMIFAATIQQEMENDPLVTEQGAMVLQGARDDVIQRFKDFNGQFAAGVFSLDNPESAPLVQNGIAISSQLIGRGLNQEKATDIGFNVQIASGVVRNLMVTGQPLDNGVVRETQRRFGTNPQVLANAIQVVQESPDFQQMNEYSPRDPDPDVVDLPVNTQNGQVVIRFAKVNGKVVPLGKVN